MPIIVLQTRDNKTVNIAHSIITSGHTYTQLPSVNDISEPYIYTRETAGGFALGASWLWPALE